ncbi:histone methylation protein DOT1-domain-containing protein [Mycena haematopus]|nr:histone methylation protein DOT1-domain-containing protein [Mycena haematopus]
MPSELLIPQYLQLLDKAIDEHDGPAFKQAFTDINLVLRDLKYPQPPSVNSLVSSVNTWTMPGIPPMVLCRILEEADQRCVGPRVKELRRSGWNPTLAYGELRAPLLDNIIQLTEITHGSLFLDLGSGVGNAVAQASLQTGCRSYGIEINRAPAAIADGLVTELRARCRMWGLRLGDIELEHGDMLISKRLEELIPKADLVLVNNERFDSELNIKLCEKLAGLKEGARVVSLVSFGTSVHARITDRDVRCPVIPFCITRHRYLPEHVSWTHSTTPQYYYLHCTRHTELADVRCRSRLRSQLHTQSSIWETEKG